MLPLPPLSQSLHLPEVMWNVDYPLCWCGSALLSSGQNTALLSAPIQPLMHSTAPEWARAVKLSLARPSTGLTQIWTASTTVPFPLQFISRAQVFCWKSWSSVLYSRPKQIKPSTSSQTMRAVKIATWTGRFLALESVLFKNGTRAFFCVSGGGGCGFYAANWSEKR